MTVAEIIAIGTELLLGEQQDSNSKYLAKQFRLLGIDVYHINIVGDNLERISTVISHACSRADIVITCGGLGPTVDDPTRAAVAHAVGTNLAFIPELWESIKNRFERSGRPLSENNRLQAYIPKGALYVENPVGTAPSFIVDQDKHVIISLPGVPFEMQYLFEQKIKSYLKNRFKLNSLIKIRVLHVAGIGESQVDGFIEDLELQKNPTVGLAAHAGQIDVRITAKAASEKKADGLINACEKIIKDRLGENIYGVDKDTLGGLVKEKLDAKKLKLILIECNTNEELASSIVESGVAVDRIQRIDKPINALELQELVRKKPRKKETVVLASSLKIESNRQVMCCVLMTPEKIISQERTFGDSFTRVIPWMTNFSLDLMRRNI